MLFGAIKNPIFAYNFEIPMRKIVGFFVLLLSLNACDDGDLTFESFEIKTKAKSKILTIEVPMRYN